MDNEDYDNTASETERRLTQMAEQKKQRIELLAMLTTTEDQSIIHEYYESSHNVFQAAIASNLNTPPDWLAKLANSENSLVASNAISNPRQPKRIFEEKYAQFDTLNDWLQNAVLRSPHLSVERQDAALKKNPKPMLLLGLTANPNLDSKLIPEIYKQIMDYAAEPVSQQTITDEVALVFTTMLSLPACPQNLLEANKNSNSRNRAAIASNPNATPELLLWMIRESNDEIAAKLASLNNNSPIPEATDWVLKHIDNGDEDWETMSPTQNELKNFMNRVDAYLMLHDYEADVLSSLPIEMKLELVAEKQ